MISVH